MYSAPAQGSQPLSKSELLHNVASHMNLHKERVMGYITRALQKDPAFRCVMSALGCDTAESLRSDLQCFLRLAIAIACLVIGHSPRAECCPGR